MCDDPTPRKKVFKGEPGPEVIFTSPLDPLAAGRAVEKALKRLRQQRGDD